MLKYEEWARAQSGYTAETQREGKPFCKISCPFPTHKHGDANASLSVRLDTGACACFGCGWKGSAEDLCKDASWPDPGIRRAPAAGTKAQPGTNGTTNGKATPSAEYVYHDPETGKAVYRVLRYDKPKKGFCQFHPDPTSWNGWRKGQGTLKNLPLFNMLDVKSNQQDAPVLFLEGEKDVLTAKAMGYLATTSPQGAGKAGCVASSSWDVLIGRTVILVPDQDAPGRAHMEDVGRRLAELGCPLRWLELPEGKDLTAWWESKPTCKLGDLVAAAPPYVPPLSSPPQPAEDVDPIRYPRTDLGNAELIQALYGQDLRYCEALGGWLWWDSRRWLTASELRAGHLSNCAARQRRDAARAMDDDEAREKELKWAASSESSAKRKAGLDQATTLPGVALESEKFDAQPWLLAVENGTINLKTGELGPHVREHLLCRYAPVSYDPKATCPTWLKFLERIMEGNTDLIEYLQRGVGYSLTGIVREHCFFFLYGVGRNGKGTFIETIQRMMGEYGQKADFETFLHKNRGDGPRNDLARLKGARFVHSSEADEGRRLAEALIKELTGGDTLTARFLHREFFDFAPSHKLFFAANSKPEIRGQDEGIWSRVHLVPFQVVIPPEERDHSLPEKLAAELPGILNWALAGCLAWQRSGLRSPGMVQQATEAYRAEMDRLGSWIGDACVVKRSLRTLAKDLYANYKTWAEEQGEYVWNQKQWGARMSQKGLERVKEGGLFYWYGIGLIAPDRSEPAESDDQPYARPRSDSEALANILPW